MQLFSQYYHSGGDGGSHGKGSRNFQKVRKLNYRCHILTQNRWGEYASAWLEKDRKDQAAEEKDRWSTLKLTDTILFRRERHLSMVLPGADPEGEGKNFKSVKKIFKAFAQTYFGNLVQVPPRSEPSHWARESFHWTQVLAQVGIWQFVKFWHFGLLVCWHLITM